MSKLKNKKPYKIHPFLVDSIYIPRLELHLQVVVCGVLSDTNLTLQVQLQKWKISKSRKVILVMASLLSKHYCMR